MDLTKIAPTGISLKNHIHIRDWDIQFQIPCRGKAQLRSSTWGIEIILVSAYVYTLGAEFRPYMHRYINKDNKNHIEIKNVKQTLEVTNRNTLAEIGEKSNS